MELEDATLALDPITGIISVLLSFIISNILNYICLLHLQIGNEQKVDNIKINLVHTSIVQPRDVKEAKLLQRITSVSNKRKR